MDPFTSLVQALHDRQVRFVVIGLWGANYYAHAGAVVFATRDRDLFLPLDAENLVQAWRACETLDLSLWMGNEPLDVPRDRWLAEQVVDRRVTTCATGGSNLQVDLSLVMSGFDFETVWREHRVFTVEGVQTPVSRLRHIVESKAAAGRPKDRLFLATHAEALRELLGRDERKK